MTMVCYFKPRPHLPVGIANGRLSSVWAVFFWLLLSTTWVPLRFVTSSRKLKAKKNAPEPVEVVH